jgi:hypothetical protein
VAVAVFGLFCSKELLWLLLCARVVSTLILSRVGGVHYQIVCALCNGAVKDKLHLSSILLIGPILTLK